MSESQTAIRDEFFESLLGDFLDESGQLLDRLNENLLELDQRVQNRESGDDHGDADLLNEMFRSAHSLKGLSAMLGLTDINTLTHKVENVFDAARKSELSVDGDVVEVVFQAIDRLVGLVGCLKDADSPPVECDSVVGRIGTLLEAAGVARQQTSQADAEKALSEQFDTPAPTNESTVESVAEVPQTASADAAAEDHFSGLTDDIEAGSKYLPIFLDETGQSLDDLTETMLALEGGGAGEAIEKLLIISHRIKGSAASVGLNRPAKLAHLMEDLLQSLVETGRSLSPRLTDALLACTDSLRRYVEGLRRGESLSSDFERRAGDLLAAQRTEGEPEQKDRPASGRPVEGSPASCAGCGIAAELRATVDKASRDRENTLVGRVTFQPDLALVGLKARLVYEKLSNAGEVCHFDPPLVGLEEVESLAEVQFGVITDKTLDDIRSRMRISGVSEVEIGRLCESPAAPMPASGTPIAASSPKRVAATAAPATEQEAAQKKARGPESANKPGETLRVDIERLDQLMNLAGQLVINKARFSQIAERLRGAVSNKRSSQTLHHAIDSLKKMAEADDTGGDPGAEVERLRNQARRMESDLEAVRRDVESILHVRAEVNDLFETIHQLDRVSNGIQKSVMDTRMLPIGPLFGRFKRVIRDITRSNDRLINLVIKGEKTELDKRMIDELGDPLIHMVRNSADHGIEMPDVREAAGKPREGTITLDAFHQGNSIVIQVTDDGKGLDAERIRRKAIEKGVITEADAEKMTRHEVHQLVWEPGLSTAEKVTEVSGRGMGMDIVKSKIDDLNGAIELDSEPGKGTRITIKLPLTLAIMPSLMVEIDGDVLAMPLEAVEEIISTAENELSTVCGRRLARVRGRVIPAIQLDELLSWTTAANADRRAGDETITLVVVGQKGREIGLVVDRVLGEEDIVIKAIAENYRNVQGIAGASILGDGRVSLILDLASLIEMAARKNAVAASGEDGR